MPSRVHILSVSPPNDVFKPFNALPRFVFTIAARSRLWKAFSRFRPCMLGMSIFHTKRMKLLGRNFFRKFFSLACVMIKPPTTAVSEVVLAAADIYRQLSSSLSHPLITRHTSRRSTLASDFSATEEATICRSIVFINLSFVLIIW